MNDRSPTNQRPKLPPEIAHLTGFPLPPSANELYATVGRKRVKSASYRSFERSAMAWMKYHSAEIDVARELTLAAGPRRFIHVDTVFYMLRGRILCKDGNPKRNDTSNRIKALHDALAKILGIDDSYFFSGSYDKLGVEDENKVGVDITMVISDYQERPCDSPRW